MTKIVKLDGKPIPEWDGGPGYLDFWGRIPNDKFWIAYLRGCLYGLSDNWDPETGDPADATETALNIYDGLEIGELNMGVTDHGDLTGLGEDDHAQYHNDARGDSRYYTKTYLDGMGLLYRGEYGHGYYGGPFLTKNGTGNWSVLTISGLSSYGGFSVGSNSIRVSRSGHYRVEAFCRVEFSSDCYVLLSARYNGIVGGRTSQTLIRSARTLTIFLPAYTLPLAANDEVGLSILLTNGSDHKIYFDNAAGGLTLTRVL